MALAVDSQESAGAGHNALTAAGATTGTLSWSFTNTAGNLLVLFVFITFSNAANATASTASATYNGVNMTAMAAGLPLNWFTAGSGTVCAIFGFTLSNPATGANTVAVSTTCAGNTGSTNGYEQIGMAISFSGASGTVGTAATNTNTVGSTSSTVSLTGTTNGSIVLSCAQAGISFSGAGAGVTQSAIDNASAAFAGGNAIMGDQATTGGTITPTYNLSASDVWGTAAVEVFAAATAKLFLPSGMDGDSTGGPFFANPIG